MWLQDTLIPSFEKPTSGGKLSLNDPLCMMYCLAGDEAFHGRFGWKIIADQDIRVVVTGQCTRGATVLIKNDLKAVDSDNVTSSAFHDGTSSNRLRRCVGIPDKTGAGRFLLSRIIGQMD